MKLPATTRALLAPVAPGADLASFRTGANTSSHSATQRVLAEGLRRISIALRDLADQVGELADNYEHTLDVPPESSLMSAMLQDRAGTLLSVHDVAAKLSVSVATVRRWRRAGRLPGALEMGGVVRWRSAAIEQWLLDQGEK